MQDYQKEFIEFLVRTEALRFGEFTLKSGRKSPYFFNSGQFNTGSSAERLGFFYASAARELKVIDVEIRYIDENGRPLSAQQFVERLMVKLPGFFLPCRRTPMEIQIVMWLSLGLMG